MICIIFSLVKGLLSIAKSWNLCPSTSNPPEWSWWRHSSCPDTSFMSLALSRSEFKPSRSSLISPSVLVIELSLCDVSGSSTKWVWKELVQTQPWWCFIQPVPQAKLNLWFGLSVSQHRNPCSNPPAVCQDSNARYGQPVKKSIVYLPIRLKGNSQLTHFQ